MPEENNLRGRIIAMYRTILNFSKVINWSSRKAYDIVNGKQTMTGTDIDEMCKVLDVQVSDEMRSLFFNR